MNDRVAGITATTPVTNGVSSRGSSPLAQSSTTSESPMDLQQAVAQLNEHFSTQEPPITFHTSRDQGDLVVTIIDTRDNEIVRQIPSDEVLRLARNLARGNATLMTKQKA